MTDHIYAMLALTIFLASLSCYWLEIDQSPPSWDEASYLTASIRLVDALAEGGVGGYAHEFIFAPTIKAPLITALPTPIYLAFGRNPRYARYLIVGSYVALLWALFLVGSRLWRPRVGGLAAAIAGTMPLLYGLSRWYLVELPMCALVAWTIWLILKSKNFERVGYVIAVSIACGFGLLLKILYPAYLIGPLLLAAVRASKLGNLRRTLTAAILPAVFIATPWYAFNWQPVLKNAAESSFGSLGAKYGASQATYAALLVGSVSTIYCLAFVIFGLLGLFFARKHLKDSLLRQRVLVVLLWIAPMAIFVVGRNKNIRYIAPFLPAFALALAALVDQALSRIRRFREIAAIGLLAYPIYATAANALSGVNAVDALYTQTFRSEAWPHEKILKAVLAASPGRAAVKPFLIVGTDIERFNVDNLQLAAVQSRLDFDFGTTAGLPPESLAHLLDTSLAFVYFNGPDAEPDVSNPNAAQFISEARAHLRFEELEPWRLPNGGTLHVLLNRFADRIQSRLTAASFRPRQTRDPGAARVAFGNELELAGISKRWSASTLFVDLKWKALARPSHDYVCFVHILNDRGEVIAYLDHAILNNAPPSSSWQPGDIGLETVQLKLPEVVASPRILIGIFNPANQERLAIQPEALVDGNPATLQQDQTALLVN